MAGPLIPETYTTLMSPLPTPGPGDFPPHGIPWLDQIDARAARHPERIAIVAGTRTLTYGELVEHANRLASYLSFSAIPAEKYAGVAIHRDEALIPALLGAIKSGVAYIPIDPAYPSKRIETMAGSAKIHTVLTANEPPVFPQNIRTISILSAPSVSSQTFPSLRLEDPIYAIFTSGSTGEPKAASVFHSGFANLLEWYQSELDLSDSDVTLVISSPGFDLTQKNFFAPLVTGGKLILDHGTNYDISRISSLIERQQVTILNCTPSAFLPIVDAARSSGYSSLRSLRFVVLGGEPIPVARVRDWLSHTDCRAEIVNSYGPTECTDICLFHRLHRGNLANFSSVPLGSPIPNVAVSVLNENLTPIAPGQVGEICISGAGVGGGYLHDSERTHCRFPQENLYRTGDLGTQLPDGTFEFRGRADHQIKLNGFRIELGEIEATLSTHSAVTGAIITHKAGTLTAHITGEATADVLKSFLSARLPAHMVPGRFIIHPEFPVTPHGKIDRLKLTETSSVSQPNQHPQPMAGNDLETAILALWSEILGHPVSDPLANFFDIGGTSIHLATAHIKLSEVLKRDIPITDLFAYPTPSALARHLSPTAKTKTLNAAERAKLSRAKFQNLQRTSRP